MTERNSRQRLNESDFERGSHFESGHPFHTEGESKSERSPGRRASGASARDEGAVRRTAKDVSRQVKQGVGEVKEKASSAVNKQREAAAEKVSAVGSAIRETAKGLHDKNVPGIAGLVEQAADSIERLSESIRESDFRDLVNATQDWARRHPAIFLGGSLVAGMLIARFLKSSAESSNSHEFEEFERGINRYGGEDENETEDEGDYSRRQSPSMSQYSSGSQPPASATPGMTVPIPGQTGSQLESSITSEETT